MDAATQTSYFRLFSLSLPEEYLELSVRLDNLENNEKATATQLSEKKISSHLSCTISFAQYQQLLSQRWLNLNPDTNKNQPFIAEHPIQLDITPKPELLSQFLVLAETLEEIITQLQILGQNQSDNREDIHPLLQEQNWYCTTLKQAQPNGEEIICHTLWHYLLPTLQDPTSDNIADSITHYITDQTTASLNQITQATDPLFQDIAQTFQELFTNTLTNLDTEDQPDNSEPLSLLTALTDFLDAEDWPYARLPNQTPRSIALRLGFRGESGQWSCYASIDQTQQTLCFYSISPITAEPDQHPAIAEFITRANYGMVLGNFEFDYSDGEIRYKTSIDVEDTQLTPALIKNLVYTNVMTMDQYLPGIIAVIEDSLSPIDAITQVET